MRGTTGVSLNLSSGPSLGRPCTQRQKTIHTQCKLLKVAGSKSGGNSSDV